MLTHQAMHQAACADQGGMRQENGYTDAGWLPTNVPPAPSILTGVSRPSRPHWTVSARPASRPTQPPVRLSKHVKPAPHGGTGLIDHTDSLGNSGRCNESLAGLPRSIRWVVNLAVAS